jgi:hypothetical protein
MPTVSAAQRVCLPIARHAFCIAVVIVAVCSVMSRQFPVARWLDVSRAPAPPAGTSAANLSRTVFVWTQASDLHVTTPEGLPAQHLRAFCRVVVPAV